MTRNEAKEIIKEYGNNTAWFEKTNRYTILGDDLLTKENLYTTFRHYAKVGEAEAMCIIAALKLAGADVK